MNDILPECLEVQFGWVKDFKYIISPGDTDRLTYYPTGANEFRLRLVQTGSCIYSCNDQSWPLDRGSLILQPPLAPETTIVTRVIEDCNFICVGFRLLLFGNIDITPQLLHTPIVWRPDLAAYEALDAMMRLLLDRSTPSTMSASFIRDGLLRAIIGLIWEPVGMTHVTEGQHAQAPKWLAFVMQELRHYPGMTVTELERLTGYSRTHLDRLFLQHVGTSPRIYLQRYRFDLAKHLLLTTEMSICAISDHLGFSNTTGFIRFFRRLGELTPLEYRQTGISSQEFSTP